GGRHPSENLLQLAAPRRKSVGRRIGRVDFDGFVEEMHSLPVLREAAAMHRRRPQEQVVCGEAYGRLTSYPFNLDRTKLGSNGPGDLTRDAVLNFENVIVPAAEPARPDVCAVRRINQLDRNAQAILALAQAAPNHIAHVEFGSDLLNVERLPRVRER